MKKNILLVVAMLWVFTACNNKSKEGNTETANGTETSADVNKTPSVKTSTTDGTSDNKVVEKKAEANDNKEAEAMAQIKFEQTNHDFGDIAEGTLAKHTFKFTNTGKVPLIIKDARGSCGCTVPDWPREPIGPGKEGEIKVQFNSQGRSGMQTKTVTLTTNTQEGVQTLQIKAKVSSTSKMQGPLKQ
ncbi:MAG TPA: hypothetical protein DCS93_26030 [Microscillaceae bacterium]|nr:hypothetical protein [Microscillaceae bacterium]